jgi:hypothetical protein
MHSHKDIIFFFLIFTIWKGEERWTGDVVRDGKGRKENRNGSVFKNGKKK